jgi:hypothetical protein
LRAFSVKFKHFALQPAHYEAFTQDIKTGALYDNGDISFDTKSGHFHRNSLKINRMALRSERAEKRQNFVTYINKPFTKPEKPGLFGDV